MANPTTNFGWVMPTTTDLVTDLPADFAVFGQGVDTSMAELKGGTTGQILSKTSATDMDFTWIANDQGDITGVTAGVGISGGGTSGTVTVTNDMATTITAAGDLVVGTGSGTYDNLPIGTTAQVLTADTTVSPYKVKWAAASSGKVVQIVYATTTTAVSNSTSTDADTNLTATITPSSASNSVLVLVTQGGLEKSSGNANSQILIKLFRSATNIGQIYGAFTATALQLRLPSGSFSILDAPSTTSATTYKTMFQNPINAADVSCQINSSRSSIVLIEVTP